MLLNAAPARQLSNDLLDFVDILVVNRVEAEMMSDLPVSDRESALKMLPKLARGGQAVIITLGGQGLVFQDKDQVPHSIEPHKIIVKSTHGAGDCFIGVLAHELSKGTELYGACTLANQSAAKYVAGLELH